MTEEKPTAAFILSLLGLVLQVLGALPLLYATSFYAQPNSYPWMFMMHPWMMSGSQWTYGLSYWFPLFTIMAIGATILGGLGVAWINSTNLSRVRTGSILVLVASIIAFPTMFGFLLGSLLMFVGSILGLTWQPRRS